jgi:hypothetical protein
MWTDREMTMLVLLGALGLTIVMATAIYARW